VSEVAEDSATRAAAADAPSTGTAGGVRAQRVLVVGGSSEIALAIVAELQRRGPCEVSLLGRDPARLEQAAAVLRDAGCERVVTQPLEARDRDGHGQTLASAVADLGGLDTAIVAVGVLGERGGMPDDIAAALDAVEVNLLGAGSLLLHTAALMRERGGGRIAVLSSVAAERPRRANVVYGAAKAGLDALARGLDDDLHEDGVRVLVVRPGFVHTRMTHGLRAAPLATTPEAVARATVKGLDRGAQTVWVPAALRWPMLAIRLLPRQVLRRVRA
jgi:decaprenylphospho-beta-D-erythro-pentofuranosid-2-ulose 2-reductase